MRGKSTKFAWFFAIGVAVVGHILFFMAISPFLPIFEPREEYLPEHDLELTLEPDWMETIDGAYEEQNLSSAMEGVEEVEQRDEGETRPDSVLADIPIPERVEENIEEEKEVPTSQAFPHIYGVGRPAVRLDAGDREERLETTESSVRQETGKESFLERLARLYDYEGEVTFFVTISETGEVKSIQRMRFSPVLEVEGEEGKAKQALTLALTTWIEETWHYLPSVTASGEKVASTKKEKVTISRAQGVSATNEKKPEEEK